LLSSASRRSSIWRCRASPTPHPNNEKRPAPRKTDAGRLHRR
jgi:hypothetical protein